MAAEGEPPRPLATDAASVSASVSASASAGSSPMPGGGGGKKAKSKSSKPWSRLTSTFSHRSFLGRFAPTPGATRVPGTGGKRRKSSKSHDEKFPLDADDEADAEADEDAAAVEGAAAIALGSSPTTPTAPPTAEYHRRVYVNAWPRDDSPDSGVVFPSNEIRTTKYTLLSFLPRNLAEQFRRVANSYFLLMVVLQFIPALEVADPSFAALPIVCIVAATAMKDGLEDFRRRIQDKRLNEELTVTLTNWANVNQPRLSWRDRLSVALGIPALRSRKPGKSSRARRASSATAAAAGNPDADVLNSAAGPRLGSAPVPSPTAADPAWMTAKWKNVQVGDFVLLRNNDSIPADVVIVATSELDNMCYIETKSLDGETNLKIRRGPAETAWVRSPADCTRLQGVLQCDPPNPALYKFQGTMVVRKTKRHHHHRHAAAAAAHGKGEKEKQGARGSPTSGSQPSTLPPPFASEDPILAQGPPAANGKDGGASPIPRRLAPLPVTSAGAAAPADLHAAAEAPPKAYYDADIEPAGPPSPNDDEDVHVDASARSSSDDDDEEEDEFLRIPLTMNSVLLRGCVVRNSEWVIGLVIYTGSESKIQLNAGATPSKRTRIEKQMNPQVILNFLILFAMSLVCGITHILYFSAFNFEAAPFALEPYDRDPAGELYVGIITFFTCSIIFQNILPISLYVTVEIVKTAQAYFIHADETMYDEEFDRPCSVKSWNLSDDLGQIEYVFSDKTGTLTRNVMELRKVSIDGVVYGDAFVKADPATQAHMLAEFKAEVKAMTTGSGDIVTHKPTTFVDRDALVPLRDPNSKVREFFLLLALCHTVLPEKVTDADNDVTTMTYKAQSPDEEALVTAAQSLGITFINRSQANMVVSVLGELRVYDVLEIIEFNSTRKRMTVIVRDPDRGILVLCKGADSVIFERMAHGHGQADLKHATLNQLQWFANDGLRTLCMAYRVVDEETFAAWHARYQEAALLAVGRDEAMDQVADDLEQGLTLLGATAIEDKLQDQVPETIQKLIAAGIKIWVLTGDKVETAITIGFSCNLLERDMTMIVIQGDDYKSTRRQLQQSLATLLEEDEAARRADLGDGDEDEDATDDTSSMAGTEPLVESMLDAGVPGTVGIGGGAGGIHSRRASQSSSTAGARSRHSTATSTAAHQARSSSAAASSTGASSSAGGRGRTRYALVIDGSSLKYALEKENRLLFLEVGCRCTSVVCCRVSPLQKAQVVALVRKELDCLSLSIGDGANDVSMIQEANVGIGIAGLEGYQAVMASDYAIAQFKYIQQLLLVHGRWSYRRIAAMNLTFFYKNIVWTFVLFWAQFYCGFSADITFEYSYVNYYNLFFTVMPTMLLGILDQDVPANRALAFPKLYSAGLKQAYYNSAKFWVHILDALYQSVVCYFVGYFLYTDAVASPHGWASPEHYEVGTAMATYAITTANVYIAMNFKSWSWIMAVGVPLNLLLFPLYVYVYAVYSADSPIAGLERVLLGSPAFWISIPLAVFLSVFPRFALEYYRVNYYPSDVDLVRQLPRGEVEGDFPPGHHRHHRPHINWLERLWHPPARPQAATPGLGPHQQHQHPPIYMDEEVELRPRTASRTAATALGAVVPAALDNILDAVNHAVDTVRIFGRTQREKLSRRMNSAVPPRERPSFVMYMGAPDATRRYPHTGFAFSADEGLPPMIRRRSRGVPEGVTSDAVSDSHVEISRSRAAARARKSGHARMLSL
ncbi:phospholipid transporting ATPase [Blastocladiella emersonii ATCC 22665]|nr:phospholipid transporting ATPase [Blastocladiella emersonii ATCC 22665]